MVVHWLAGDLADALLLAGRRFLPDKAKASGFNFRHETLRCALRAILGATPASDSSIELDPTPAMWRAR
jgi:NAD dependent epimerase/dehydratase family enzyme